MAKINLHDLFTKDQSFGPISSPDIRDPELMKRFFCAENLIYKEFASCPSLIIGRRGAGKTAFLRSIYLNSTYRMIIELKPHAAFRQIIESIQELATGIVFAEEVSDLWDMIFWHTIIAQLVDYEEISEDLNLVKQYASNVGLKKMKNPYSIMRMMLKIFKERGGDNPLSMISEFIDEIAFDGITFTDAKIALINFLEYENIRAIILLDSLESFPLDDTTMCHAISGLLRCQGGFHYPGSPCEIRCCIPSEIYHRLEDLSSNPNKDFQHRILIHWHAAELIEIAAHRYLQFLEIHHPGLYTQFSDLDASKRSDAITLWRSLLPIRIQNGLGGIEDPLAYILRHTQLLPRHLLTYLNQISLKNQNGNPVQFSSDSILKGVHETEDIILEDILSGFKYVYPEARSVCERCIPLLPLHFSDGDLHRVYNQRGKGVSGIFDYRDFKTMLLEIGAIGRVTSRTDRYIIGLFEYTIPHKLITDIRDELCLHPVFSEIFHAIKPKPDGGNRTVYPYGSDIDEKEFRELRP